MNSAAARVATAPSRAQLSLLHQADLLYCLARAFMPPPQGWSVRDWAQPLQADLDDIGPMLGLDVSGVQAALQAECQRWAAAARLDDGAADAWLVEYSRLFLVPPMVVPLNTGLYLEGAVGGTAAQMMRSCYETAGIVPDDGFHDLPDHVAIQIEFLARLVERGARGDDDGGAMADEFATEFVHAWAGSLEQACAAAAGGHPAAAVFAALARLLRQALGDPSLGRG
jgi:TorA maturation chaperone TorD